MPDPQIPAGPRVVAILNCHAPNGANAGQLALFADGTAKAFGDTSLIRNAIRIGCRIPHLLTRILHACDDLHASSPTLRKTRPKASSSDPAATAVAGAAE